MVDAFDPYHKWLAIPPEEQPPHHYRLLGIKLFEQDLDVIESAADRQMAHVHKHKTGKHSAQSQQLLNELAAARVCLLNSDQRAAYDTQLRARMAPEIRPVELRPTPSPLPSPIAIKAAPARRHRPPWWRQPMLVAPLAVCACVVLLTIYLVQSNERPLSPPHGQQQPSSDGKQESHLDPTAARPVVSAQLTAESSPSWTEDAILALSMEEGRVLPDLSGSGNDAQRHNAATAPGKVNQALDFKTAQDFLECPDTTSLNPKALSIAVWVKGSNWGSRPAAENVVVSKQDWARKGAPRGYELRIGGRAGRASFNLGGGAWKEVVAEGLKSGEWHFLVATYDGQTQRLFVNGAEQASNPIAIPIEPSPYPLNVGRGPYARQRHFVGAIDELALWSRALTATEVKQLYDFSQVGRSYCEAIAEAHRSSRRERTQ